MGWDPVGDIGRSISKAATEIGNGLEDVRKVAESGDVGKVIKSAGAPIAAPINAANSLARGDIEAALQQALSTVTSGNPLTMAINSSSTLRGYLKDDDGLNNLTLGLSRDAARNAEASENLYEGVATTSDYSDMLRYNTRAALYAVGGAAAKSYGVTDKAVGYATEHPLEAVVVGKMASEGNYTGIMKGALNDLAPEWSLGDKLEDALSALLNPGIPKPTTPGTISTPGQKAPIDPLLKAAAIALGSLLLILVIKKMRKKKHGISR